MITDEVLDEIQKKYWSWDHLSFNYRAFAREIESLLEPPEEEE